MDGDIHPVPAAPTTTARLYHLEVEGERCVAKIVDAPDRRPQAERECAILHRLGPRLSPLVPRLLASRIEPASIAAVVSHIDGDGLSGRSHLPRDTVEQVLSAMARIWRIDPQTTALAGLDLPNWGEGSASRPRRRIDRYHRRAAAFAENRPRTAARHLETLDAIGRILERLARRDWSPSKHRRHSLIHGDLHADNIVLTTDGPRFLDWQTASLGDPLADLVRFELESRPGRSIDDLLASAARLDGPPAERIEVATTVVDCYAGLISGLAGRVPSRLNAHESMVLERLLAPDHHLPAVTEAIEEIDAIRDTHPRSRAPR